MYNIIITVLKNSLNIHRKWIEKKGTDMLKVVFVDDEAVVVF